MNAVRLNTAQSTSAGDRPRYSRMARLVASRRLCGGDVALDPFSATTMACLRCRVAQHQAEPRQHGQAEHGVTTAKVPIGDTAARWDDQEERAPGLQLDHHRHRNLDGIAPPRDGARTEWSGRDDGVVHTPAGKLCFSIYSHQVGRIWWRFEPGHEGQESPQTFVQQRRRRTRQRKPGVWRRRVISRWRGADDDVLETLPR